MVKKLNKQQQLYVEDVALYYETFGLPRIAGRILGWLMICDPPERTASELMQELGASKGSVSTMLRLLLTGGIVRRVAKPRSRVTHYAFQDDGFEAIMDARLAEYNGFEPLAQRGLQLLREQGASREQTRRLRTQRAMYLFLRREFAALAIKWRAEREQLINGEDGS